MRAALAWERTLASATNGSQAACERESFDLVVVVGINVSLSLFDSVIEPTDRQIRAEAFLLVVISIMFTYDALYPRARATDIL